MRRQDILAHSIDESMIYALCWRVTSMWEEFGVCEEREE
jgi:hypothetical protein